MDESIEVSLARIESCIEAIGREEFTTADVVRQYSGRFCANLGTPAAYSFNAQFGKLLQRNETRLGIIEVASNESTEDDHGHSTTTSRWRVITLHDASAVGQRATRHP